MSPIFTLIAVGVETEILSLATIVKAFISPVVFAGGVYSKVSVEVIIFPEVAGIPLIFKLPPSD